MAVEGARNVWWNKPWRLHAGLCAFAAAIVLIFGNPLETSELQWFGQCLRWRFAAGLAPAVERSIVHLNIDSEDFENLPNLESEYAAATRIVQQASALGASVIVFDIIFARASPQTAQPLREAIAEHKNVVLAEALTSKPGETQPAALLRSFPFRDDRPTPAGLINLAADADGVIRHYNFAHRTKERDLPSLALAVYLARLGLDWKKDISFPTGATIQWQELSPEDFVTMVPHRAPRGPVLLNVRCPWAVESGPAAFDYMNLRQLDALFQVHAADPGAKPLANKILLVSYVATGLGDLGATIFGPNEPLVYLHSTALNDLMQSRWLRRSNRLIDVLWISSALLVLAGAYLCRSKWTLLVWWIAGVALILTAAGLVLLRFDIVLPSVATATLWTVAMVLEIGRRHTSELMQRQRLRYTMGLYFSPRVLKDVLENPGRLEPKRVEITVLLTDLRNSTALAEELGTEGMLELLNRIFTVENAAVFAEDGSLEKPVGDQFLAYWGAPDPQPDSADRALRAALAVIDGLESLRETLEPRTRELFGYGVALHAGQSLIANIGSSQFFHYGVIGDLLNATARVESLTKFYGVLVLVTRNAYNRFSTAPEARVLDRVVVKGKTSSLELLEVRNATSPENFIEIATSYAEAFAAYEEGEFNRAEKMFDRTSSADRPSAVMALRCRELQSNPPEKWEGAYTFLTK